MTVLKIPEKYPQGRCGGNVEQSLRTKDEICKATAQELHKHRQ